MPRVFIDNFGGGKTNKLYSSNPSFAKKIQHFDILTDSKKLIPFYGNKADGSTGDTEKIVRFAIGSDGVQYGLGVVSGSSKVKIFERAELPDGAWGASTTGEDSGGIRSETTFINYKDVLYGFSAGNRVWSYAYLTNTFTSTAKSLASTYTNTTPQGLVHSKDDILYMAYENRIISKNDTAAFTDPALTLPTDLIITDLAEFGNFLAIACRSKIAGGNSVVYLWDRDSSLTTISEKIDWGTGALMMLEELDGYLIGVSSFSGANSIAISPKLTFRYSTGIKSKSFLEIPTVLSGSNVFHTFGGKQKVDNRILFGLSANINGENQDGVFSLGLNDDGNIALSLDTLITNTAPTLPHRIKGFQLIGNYMTIAYLDDDADGDPYKIVVTDDTNTYSFNSIWESLINPGIDDKEFFANKQIKYVALRYDSLPTAARVRLYYKVDGGSWETNPIIDETTDGALVTETLCDSNKLKLKSGRRIEFKIDSTGGGVVSGFYFDYDVLKTFLP